MPLGGYAAPAAVAAGMALFAVTARRRGVRLPDRVPPWDVVLLGGATFKASRLPAKDKVTGFPRGTAAVVPSATWCPARSAPPSGWPAP